MVNPFLEFVQRYRTDPVLFVREVFAAEPDEWQTAFLAALGRGDRRISVRSGHGVGKSTAVAWAAWWHFLTRWPQKTVMTAPSSAQLFDALWSEFRAWGERLPKTIRDLILFKADRAELVRSPESSFVSVRTSRAENPEALQGVHAEGGVLLIADEASGVPDSVFVAASGSMSGHNATTVLTGNPVRISGLFFDTHHKLRETWTTFHVPCTRSRFVSADFVGDMKARYGEDSNEYRVRVLGEFPIVADDTVIPWDLVEASRTRDVTPSPSAPVIWGVDCARFGHNRSALAKRRGNALFEPVRWWRGLDTMQLAARIKHEYDGTHVTDKPLEINVDAIGLGAGVVDRLRELGLPARGINVSEAPGLDTETYRNLRAELWFRMKAWFVRRDCKIETLPGDEHDLVGELTKPRYKYGPATGKLQVESKDEMRKRGLESPDLADAFALTFASDAVGLAFGSAGGRSAWKKPLDWQIKGLV